jgi:hypothetical protein
VECVLGHTAVEAAVFKHVLVEEAIEVVSVRATGGVARAAKGGRGRRGAGVVCSRCGPEKQKRS